MALKDNPALHAEYLKLLKERGEIEAQAAPLRAEYDVLRAQEEVVQVSMKALAGRIRAIELPRKAEIDRQMSEIARATGGKRMGEAPTQ